MNCLFMSTFAGSFASIFTRSTGEFTDVDAVSVKVKVVAPPSEMVWLGVDLCIQPSKLLFSKRTLPVAELIDNPSCIRDAVVLRMWI